MAGNTGMTGMDKTAGKACTSLESLNALPEPWIRPPVWET